MNLISVRSRPRANNIDSSSMATIAPPQRPPSQDAGLHLIRELNLNGERQFGFPTPPTGHELMEMWPALAPQIPHSPGSSFFHSQERAFFSRDNSFFQVQIEIDVPYTNQALGGPYRQDKGKTRADPPQLSAIPTRQQPPLLPPQQTSPSSSSWNVSPPSQHQSPSERRRTQPLPQPTKPHRSQTIPINPLPVSTGPANNHHMNQYQATHHSQYPYPPPELRHKSPTIVDDDAWRYPTPYSERRRAGRAPRRKGD